MRQLLYLLIVSYRTRKSSKDLCYSRLQMQLLCTSNTIYEHEPDLNKLYFQSNELIFAVYEVQKWLTQNAEPGGGGGGGGTNMFCCALFWPGYEPRFPFCGCHWVWCRFWAASFGWVAVCECLTSVMLEVRTYIHAIRSKRQTRLKYCVRHKAKYRDKWYNENCQKHKNLWGRSIVSLLQGSYRRKVLGDWITIRNTLVGIHYLSTWKRPPPW